MKNKRISFQTMIHTMREKDGELWSTLQGRREDDCPCSENNLCPAACAGTLCRAESWKSGENVQLCAEM